MAQDDYTSRILPQEGIGTLQLGPQAYIDPRDQRYVHDAYQYFLNQQGQNVPQDLMTGDITGGSNITPVTGDTGIVNAGVTAPDYLQGAIEGGNTIGGLGRLAEGENALRLTSPADIAARTQYQTDPNMTYGDYDTYDPVRTDHKYHNHHKSY